MAPRKNIIHISAQILKSLWIWICICKWMHPQTAHHCRSLIICNWCTRLLKHKSDKTHFAGYSLYRKEVERAKYKQNNAVSDATIVTRNWSSYSNVICVYWTAWCPLPNVAGWPSIQGLSGGIKWPSLRQWSPFCIVCWTDGMLANVHSCNCCCKFGLCRRAMHAWYVRSCIISSDLWMPQYRKVDESAKDIAISRNQYDHYLTCRISVYYVRNKGFSTNITYVKTFLTIWGQCMVYYMSGVWFIRTQMHDLTRPLMTIDHSLNDCTASERLHGSHATMRIVSLHDWS